MAAIHKIGEDFFEDSFSLIALHTSLEDYALGYALNKSLKVNFRRTRKDFEIKPSVSFHIFEWRDEVNDSHWSLIANNSVKLVYTSGRDLFGDEPTFAKNYLLPEYKEVDFFIKIEQDYLDGTHLIVKQLLGMPEILTAYRIDVENLKSKNNLIF
ncbi:IPExxxVDY family protein [Maribacter algicola]|uniref:IPExxxVDY family protein n=1 Tax=Meishania litoralis TaxID=3434685 RepID=A0ACC7LIZ5_9FLAO